MLFVSSLPLTVSLYVSRFVAQHLLVAHNKAIGTDALLLKAFFCYKTGQMFAEMTNLRSHAT
jgi:hypothetical protein